MKGTNVETGEPREFANKLLDDWLQHRSRKMNRPHMRKWRSPIFDILKNLANMTCSVGHLFRPP